MNETRRTDGNARGDGIGPRRGLWTRREFIAAWAAAGLAVLGLGAAGGALTAAPSDPAAEEAASPPAGGGQKRSFTHKGKRVEIVEDARGADLSIDGKKVRAKKVSGMYRAPGFAFLPAHTPDELAKGMIDYDLALDAKAAGKKSAAGSVGSGGHEGGH